MSCLASLPRISSDATSVPELIELSRTTSLAISDRGYEVLSYTACHTALSDEKFDKVAGFRQRLDAIGITEGSPSREDWDCLLPAVDGELRKRLRVMYASMMRPARIAKFKDSVREIVAGVVDDFGDNSTVDLLAELAWKVPSRMYCELVSVPFDLAPKAAQLSESVQGPLVNQDASRRQEAIDALYEAYSIVEEHIEKRRENLGDDFTSHMIRHEIEGKISRRVLLLNAVGLLIASIDNTVFQLAITIGTLLERRDIWERLVADPTLIPAAVEEVIRMRPRLSNLNRIAQEGAELEGHKIPAGAVMFISAAAAHRDETVIDDPDEFRLDREGFRTLEFGGGNFNCLGQHLARLEIQEAVLALVTRYPNARLAEGFTIKTYMHGGEVDSLKVELN